MSKCFLDIEQYVEFKMSVLISPSKSLISSRWVTNVHPSFLISELAQFDRRQKREIRHLENEIPKWQVMVDSVTGECYVNFMLQRCNVMSVIARVIHRYTREIPELVPFLS